MRRMVNGVGLATGVIISFLSIVTVQAEELPTPLEIHSAPSLNDDNIEALLKPARNYYAFWNTIRPMPKRLSLPISLISIFRKGDHRVRPAL